MNVKTKVSPGSIVRDIKRKTRRKFTAEEKIRIVLVGLRGEESITDLCRREGIHPTMYYKWSKAFLEVEEFLLLLYDFHPRFLQQGPESWIRAEGIIARMY